MKRLARPTLIFAAAILAGGIALLSALEAWRRLQHADGGGAGLPDLLSATLFVVVLPALAVASLIVITRIARHVRAAHSTALPAGTRAFDDAAPTGAAVPRRAARRTSPGPTISS